MLINGIMNAYDVIFNTLGIFQRVRQFMHYKCNACNEVGGRHSVNTYCNKKIKQNSEI